MLTSHAQISISSLQITGEKLKCGQEPGGREIILHSIIRNATCFGMLYFSIHQPMWYLCTSLIWLQPYSEIRSGNMVSRHQHRAREREFLSACVLLTVRQPKSPVDKHQSSEKALSLQKTMPPWKKYIHPNSLVMVFTFLFTQTY